MVRLDAHISSILGIPRGNARTLMRSGEVSVGGEAQTEPRWQVVLGEEHTVTLRGAPLQGGRPFSHVLLLVHKPRGVHCERFRGSAAWNAARGIPTDHVETAGCDRHSLWDLLPSSLNHPMLGAFGRLDADTSGLILMGTDGGVQSLLMHPSCGCEKAYLATLRVHGAYRLCASAESDFASGIRLANGYLCLPARLEILETEADPEDAEGVMLPSLVRVTLVEGQYHQVKRMLGACGACVDALHRERIGGLYLTHFSELSEAGAVMVATEREVAILREMLPKNRVCCETRRREH